MKILSHRGYWKTPVEKNTAVAFQRSFEMGFGTETDVRDCQGKLVISHNMPNGTEMTLNSFLELLDNRTLPLAINIKADGLADVLKTTLESYGINNWFVFDMSIPDTRAHLAAKNPVYVRMSEYEQLPVWFDKATGVWLDSFDEIWYDTNIIEDLLNKNKKVCLVSAELHNRPHDEQWALIKPLSCHSQLMLCTDDPEKAQHYFSGENGSD